MSKETETGIETGNCSQKYERIISMLEYNSILLERILSLTERIEQLSINEFNEKIMFECGNRERLINIYLYSERKLHDLIKEYSINIKPESNGSESKAKDILRYKIDEFKRKKDKFLKIISNLNEKIIDNLKLKVDQTWKQLNSINKSKRVINSYIKNQVSGCI